MEKVKYQPPRIVDLGGRTGKGQTVAPEVWCWIGHEPQITVSCSDGSSPQRDVCDPIGSSPGDINYCAPTGLGPEQGGCYPNGFYPDNDSFCSHGSIADN